MSDSIASPAPPGTGSINLLLTRSERDQLFRDLDLIAQVAGTRSLKFALELACLDYLYLPDLPRPDPQEPGTPLRLYYFERDVEEDVLALAIEKATRAGCPDLSTAVRAIVETAANFESRFLRDQASVLPAGATLPARAAQGAGDLCEIRPVNGGRCSRPRRPGHVHHGQVRGRPEVLSYPYPYPDLRTSVPRHPGDAQPALATGETDRTRPILDLDPGAVSGTYFLGSVAHLLAAAGLDLGDVERFTAEPARWYQRRTRRKRSGGRRVYHAPDPELLAVQRRLLPILRAATPVSPLLRKTPELTAATHAGAKWLVKLDIKDFYPSITAALVAETLERCGAAPEVIDLVLRLTTLQGCLIQGAATSAIIAELVLLDLDQRVHAEAERLGVTVTRWADDAAFSGGDREAVEAVADLYTAGLRELSLRVWRTGTMNYGAKFLRFNLDSRPSIPKAYRRKVEGEVYRASRHGCTPKEWNRISQKISWLAHLHPRQAKRLRDRLRSRPKTR